MRNSARIPLILDKIDFKEFLMDIGFSEQMSDRFMPNIIENLENIREYWEENPDQRLTQVLLNMDLITDPARYYYLEETDYMIRKGYFLPQELMWWGSHGKSGKEPLKWIRIKDMETEHLEACLKLFKEKRMNPPQTYIDAMQNELDSRENDEEFEKDFELDEEYNYAEKHFEVGDKVKCIRQGTGIHTLDMNKIYIVSRYISRNNLTIEGSKLGYLPDRFELIKEPEDDEQFELNFELDEKLHIKSFKNFILFESSRIEKYCGNCKKDIFNKKNYYAVKDDIWKKYGNGEKMLCINCLEKRMKRKLKYKDFKNLPINKPPFNYYIQTLKNE